MRVLLIGATGLIGSEVAARLQAEGHEVIGVTRSIGPLARRVPVARWVSLDLRQATRPEAWLPHLRDVDAVVNCAGVLQDNLRDSTAKVHHDAPVALWQACQEAGVRRVVHFSALGVDRAGLTQFSRSKNEGDTALQASSLDWVILRPSVVVGRPAYGGSALFRGLAALPLLPRTPDAGPLDIVQLDDVVETVVRLLRPGAPSRVALELSGPEQLDFDRVVAAYRRWLGWKPARLISLPAWLLNLAWRAGDLIARLGWRPPVRSTARREIVRGAIGDNREWIRLTGIQPQSLGAALSTAPASVQERWFARLYWLKPLAITVFAFFWLLTGLISLGPGFEVARNYMLLGGGGALSAPSVWAGGICDIVIGLMILYRPTAKFGLLAALAVSVAYMFAGTLLLPELWREPLGPMMKIWPILVLNLVCLAILDER